MKTSTVTPQQQHEQRLRAEAMRKREDEELAAAIAMSLKDQGGYYEDESYDDGAQETVDNPSKSAEDLQQQIYNTQQEIKLSQAQAAIDSVDGELLSWLDQFQIKFQYDSTSADRQKMNFSLLFPAGMGPMIAGFNNQKIKLVASNSGCVVEMKYEGGEAAIPGKKESQEVVRKAGMVSLCGSEDDIAAAVMLLDADLRGSELFQGINKASGGALFARKGANGQDIKTAPTKPTQDTPPPKPRSQDSYKQPQGQYQPQSFPPSAPKSSQPPTKPSSSNSPGYNIPGVNSVGAPVKPMEPLNEFNFPTPGQAAQMVKPTKKQLELEQQQQLYDQQILQQQRELAQKDKSCKQTSPLPQPKEPQQQQGIYI